MNFSIHDVKRHFGLLCCLLANYINNKGRKESLMRRKKKDLETKEKRKSVYFYPYSNIILKETFIRGKENKCLRACAITHRKKHKNTSRVLTDPRVCVLCLSVLKPTSIRREFERWFVFS